MKIESLSNAEFTLGENLLEITDAVTRAKVKIESSHSGIVNGNDVLYTPRALQMGAVSLTYPFKKHVQAKHYSKAVGVIEEAYYTDYPEHSEYRNKMHSAKSAVDLTNTVNNYLESDEYRLKYKKGLGALYAKANIYNKEKIQDLKGRSRGTVSIGGDSTVAYCNICSSFYGTCKHKKGRVYEGRKAIAIVDALNLDHIGFETIPADEETYSQIIQDSLTQSSNEIEITELSNDQEGFPMKLKTEKLKQKLLNIEEYLNELKLDALLESYNEAKELATQSEFVFPAEKLLPLNTKLGIYVAAKALESLAESVDKEAVADAIAVASTVFEGKTLEEIYVELTTPVEETPEVVEEVPTEVIPVVEEPVVEEVAPVVVEPEVVQPLQITDANAIITPILDSMQAKLDGFGSKLEQFIASVEEKINSKKEIDASSLVKQQLDAARADFSATKVSEQQLTEDLKQAIIGQIVLLKNIPEDSEYLTLLKSRTVNQLRLTLQDTLYATGTEVKSPTVEAIVTEVKQENSVAISDSVPEIVQTQEGAVTLQTAVEHMSEIPSVEIKDALQEVAEEILKDYSDTTFSVSSYNKLYVDTMKKHGLSVAKKIHATLKSQHKLPKQ